MTDFEELRFGTALQYVGPDEFDGEWSAPGGIHAPYEFRHVSMGGTLTLETQFNARRYFAPEHPANNPEYWTVVDE